MRIFEVKHLGARRIFVEGYGNRHPSVPRRRVLHVSQEQLSRQIAISHQTISLILKALEQKGVIRLHRSAVDILDFDRLRSEA